MHLENWLVSTFLYDLQTLLIQTSTPVKTAKHRYQTPLFYVIAGRWDTDWLQNMKVFDGLFLSSTFALELNSMMTKCCPKSVEARLFSPSSSPFGFLIFLDWPWKASDAELDQLAYCGHFNLANIAESSIKRRLKDTTSSSPVNLNNNPVGKRNFLLRPMAIGCLMWALVSVQLLNEDKTSESSLLRGRNLNGGLESRSHWQNARETGNSSEASRNKMVIASFRRSRTQKKSSAYSCFVGCRLFVENYESSYHPLQTT